ncbi:hypothetical protein PCANB_002606 [Pneumocystis canis]|nr:hypothetical protein PCANB_002606 [Pneumocystis canis]
MINNEEFELGDTLEMLKQKARIFEKDMCYPIKLWISTARKLYNQAFRFEAEANFEMAYIKYLRASSIVIEVVIPNHKDYISFKNQNGSILKQYQELKQETSLSLLKCQKIYQILKLKDIKKTSMSNKSDCIAYTKSTSFPSYNETKSSELSQKDLNFDLNFDFSLLNGDTSFIKSNSSEIQNIKNIQNISMSDTHLGLSNSVSKSPQFYFDNINLALPSFSPNINKDMVSLELGGISENFNEKLILLDEANVSSKFHFIEPDTLYKYIIHKDKTNILFLDVRPRSDFEKLRIASENIVCIEPIILTLQENISGDQLEESLIISPLLEQKIFSDRHKFDLVVYYDWDSKNDNLDGDIFQKEKAHVLHNLNKAIVNFGGHKKPLKKTPVLLLGGLKAWINFIKKNNFSYSYIEGINSGTDNTKEHLVKSSLYPSCESNQLSMKSNVNHSNSISSLEHSLYTTIESEKKHTDNLQEKIISMNEFELLFKNNMSQINKNKGAPAVSGSGLHGEISVKYLSQFNLSQQSTKFIPYLETNNIDDSLRNNNNSNGLIAIPEKTTSNNSNSIIKRDISFNNPFYKLTKAEDSNCRFLPHSTLTGKNALLDSFKFKELALSNINTISIKPRNFTTQNYNPNQFCIRRTVGTTGLTNLGNTCYMNAIIQCLSNTIPFAKYYRDGSYKRHINFENPLGYKGELTQTFARLISHLWDNEYTYVSPLFFKNVIGRLKEQFRNNDQQDSQEFLAFLLDGLHEELNVAAGRLKPKELTPEEKLKIENMPDKIASDIEWQRYTYLNNSIVVSLFQGQLQSRLKCLTCGFQSTTYNPFTCLSLPIPFTQAKTSTLYECLEFFVQKEYLKDKDQWYCSKCKKPRDATKTLSISKIPQILLIHLKRFRIYGHWKDKINTKVDFLINNFDLTDFLLDSIRSFSNSSNHEQNLYHLYAVTNHYGNLDGGHYTAMIRNDLTNSWNLFDDSRVIFCNENDVVSSAAYILFYIRNNIM